VPERYDNAEIQVRLAPVDRPTGLGGRFGAGTVVTGAAGGRRSSVPETRAFIEDALRAHLDFDVAGESFRDEYPDNLLRLAELLSSLDGSEWPTVVLKRDPANPYDPAAIEVHVVSGIGHVGYVPNAIAQILAPMLDDGAVISCSAVEVRIHDDHPGFPGLTISARLITGLPKHSGPPESE
jgi:HIRAN domain